MQDTVSVHRPGFYAHRFLDFMADKVFKKIPSRKNTIIIIFNIFSQFFANAVPQLKFKAFTYIYFLTNSRISFFNNCYNGFLINSAAAVSNHLPTPCHFSHIYFFKIRKKCISFCFGVTIFFWSRHLVLSLVFLIPFVSVSHTFTYSRYSGNNPYDPGSSIVIVSDLFK